MPAPRRKPRAERLFRRILVANRGEIAVRILRACREMGISPVAVCSEADRASPHARLADEVHCLGAAPAAESYLRIDRILDAARKSGSEAIHPGYGFLAENPDFAQACRDEGLVFIGPGPEAMRRLGNKIEARRALSAAGIPVIPGIEKRDLTAGDLRRWAKKTGYPILLKAAAGGGGRGMRILRSDEEAESALASARGEARSAFGDETLFAERYLEGARHIEIQVLVDREGNGISLGERECSLQRRHQKLVEESPSPVVSEAVRRRLGRYALTACRAAGYENAGTVEFLRDREGRFFFLEVNARLQVEHPITEIVTGIDLVREQIRIAAGAPLATRGESPRPRGWALECRILAEDSAADFLPSPGRLLLYRPPRGPRIRVDDGVSEGEEVSLHYDSLLAKLIAWGEDRERAIASMARALAEFRIAGLRTTIPFHRRVMADEGFRRGDFDTDSAERIASREPAPPDPEEEGAALIAAAHFHRRCAATRPLTSAAPAAESWASWGRGARMMGGFLRDPWRNR